jgi:hypothetical protein
MGSHYVIHPVPELKSNNTFPVLCTSFPFGSLSFVRLVAVFAMAIFFHLEAFK